MKWFFKKNFLECNICGSNVKKAVKRELDGLIICRECFDKKLDNTNYCSKCKGIFNNDNLYELNGNVKKVKLCESCLSETDFTICHKCNKLVTKSSIDDDYRICNDCRSALLNKSIIFSKKNKESLDHSEDIFDINDENANNSEESNLLGNSDELNNDIEVLDSVDLLRAKRLANSMRESKFTPIKIVESLNSYIIGQDNAKKKISIALFNHVLGVLNERCEIVKTDLLKNNILLIGSSGTGKTLFAKTISNIIDFPIVLTNSVGITQTGYSGRDIESILAKLIYECDFDIEKAEQGIIFIDEIDKIARKVDNANTKDINGDAVQDGLLKILEGTEIEVPCRKDGKEVTVIINTSKILFICAGAFDGIEKIVENRTSKKTIGFNSKNENNKNNNELRLEVNTKDLEAYGMKKEFLGRFSTIASLENLGVNELVDILKNAKDNIIDKYKLLFKVQCKNLSFSDDSLKLIAKLSLMENLGARGLNRIISTIMNEVLFYAPSEAKTNYNITEKEVLKYYPNAKKLLNIE